MAASKLRKIITELNVINSNNIEKSKHDEIKSIINKLLPYVEMEENIGVDLLALCNLLIAIDVSIGSNQSGSEATVIMPNGKRFVTNVGYISEFITEVKNCLKTMQED